MCIHEKQRVKSWWSGFMGSFQRNEKRSEKMWRGIETYCWWINETLHNVCTISNCNQIGLSLSLLFSPKQCSISRLYWMENKHQWQQKKKSEKINSTKLLIDFGLTTFFPLVSHSLDLLISFSHGEETFFREVCRRLSTVYENCFSKKEKNKKSRKSVIGFSSRKMDEKNVKVYKSFRKESFNHDCEF